MQTFALALVCLSLNTSVNAGDSIPKFKVIAFYSATWDQAHISYAHECNRWFPQMAELYNFEYDSTNDWTNLNAEYLSQYQVVLFLDNSPSTAQQKAGFEEYMRNGGSWMGFHVCAFNQDPLAWDWYYNQFLGMGSYKSNTWAPSTAVLQVEDTTHPATINLPDTFTAAVNEWYAWMVDLRTKSNIKILCSVHPVSFPLGDGSGNGGASEIWTSGYYPAVWSNTDYNMMYVNMGHNKVNYSTNKDLSLTFSNETENKLILDGLFWLAELNMPDPRDTRLKITSPVNGTKLLDPATFTINVNATDSDGIAKIQFYNGNTLLGADSIAPYSFSWENVGIGYYNIKVKATDSLGNVASSSVGISVEGEGAYNNEIAPIPGKIEVENFDYGGQGVGYNDSEPSNQGAQYREADGVDIEECSDSGAGYNIGYVAANEWVKYTVDVNTAGIYTLQARVATQNANKKFHVELDDEDISGLITVPNTGGWQVWKTVNVVTAHLTTGQKKMKIIMDTDGFNLNYVNFTQDPIASVEINNSNYNLVYPNPSNGIVKIKLTQVESQNAVFTVIDNLGRELKSLQHKSNDEITLNCSNFNKGIYFIKSSDNSIPVQRIIIQ